MSVLVQPPSQIAPRLSVALCTYNGARFLAQQLESLARQTRLPDELVVCDDRSSDDTVRIVENFVATAPFPVALHVNTSNVGVSENFGQAIQKCQGDLIALCDQDDVWLPHKLAAGITCFTDDPTLDALFTDAGTIDQKEDRLPGTLWEGIRFSAKQRRLVEAGEAIIVLADRFLVTGATLVFHRRLLGTILPIPPTRPRLLLHDGWIALIAASTGKLRALDGPPTMLYRLHDQQQVGLGETVTWQAKLKAGIGGRQADFGRKLQQQLADCLLTRELLAARLGRSGEKALEAFDIKIAHLNRRIALPRSRLRRVGPVLGELFRGGYHRFSQRPFFVALRDALLRG